MRHAFSTPLPLPLASPKPALAFAVLRATPRRRLVAPRRLPSPLHPGPLAALRIAVHVPAVALAADHHQPATAPTAELPSFMGFGCWVRRVDEPPGHIELKLDLRSSLCETRDLSTPLRVVDGYSRPAIVFQDCGAGLVLFDGRAEPTPLAARSKKTRRPGPCSRRKLARARDHADPHDRRQASAADTPSQAGRETFDRVLMEALEGVTSRRRTPRLRQVRSAVARLVAKKKVRIEGRTVARLRVGLPRLSFPRGWPADGRVWPWGGPPWCRGHDAEYQHTEMSMRKTRARSVIRDRRGGAASRR